MNILSHRNKSEKITLHKPYAGMMNFFLLVVIATMIASCGTPKTQQAPPTTNHTERPIQTATTTADQSENTVQATVEIPTLMPTTEPTVDPTILEEQRVNEEIYQLMQSFDDGQGLVNSYDLQSMTPEDANNLSEEQKMAFQSEKMIDQAYAVLTYIRIGKMEDARRVLGAMQDMLNGDMASYVAQNGGGRSIGWWNISVQQYYLLDPDPTLIDFMQWVDYKGYWRQPDYYSDVFGYRITGEQPDFWENETNIETLVQTIFYLKLDEKYGLDTIYGVNVEGYNVEEQRNLINQRFNTLSDSLKQILYYGDDAGLHFIEGYTLADTYTNAVVMTCLLESNFPEQFRIADVDFEGIINKIETEYAISIDEQGKTYHLYKAANEENILPSFETTLQVANAYLAAADTFDYRKAHPEQVQKYGDDGAFYVQVDDRKAAEYRQKAETIIADVWDYTTVSGFSAIPYLEKNNQLYTKFGPFVFSHPSMSVLAQYVQFMKGTFYSPLMTAQAPMDPGTQNSSDDLNTKYQFYKSFNSLEDDEFSALRIEFDVYKIDYLLEIVWVEDRVQYRLYLMPDNSLFNP